MSRGKRQLSLIGQVDARLNGMLALGQSKHQAKKDGTASRAQFPHPKSGQKSFFQKTVFFVVFGYFAIS